MLKMVADVNVHHKIGEYSVDFYVPDWKLAIEYQGEQHFMKSWKSGDLQM